MKFRGRMKARIAPAVLGEPESGKTSQRLRLLMQRSLGGSEHRRWLRTRLRGIRLWGEAEDRVDLVSRNISIGKFGAPHIVI